MFIYKEKNIRDRAQKEIKSAPYGKTVNEILTESTEYFWHLKNYDIFLSHSFRDAELIYGMKLTLEDMQYQVYVDWIDDPKLERSKVSTKTAETLRKRLRSCKSLLYVTTENSSHSKWMPWECGYFDGYKGKVAIIPITKLLTVNYYGQEYLGLYPYCKEESNKLHIHKSRNDYILFDEWIK